jgi:Zn-dependent peptidase ImmA (M78 family)
MMRMLEDNGIRVFSLPPDAAEAGTFSVWHRDRPFVFLNMTRSGHELRFDLARELGHVLLHHERMPTGPSAQHAASEFAAALLMPAAAMSAEVRSPPAIDQLMSLASKWGAPLGAAAARPHQLQLVSDWQYRRLRDAISTQSAVDRAEARQPHEGSPLLLRVFATLRAHGVTKQRVASILRIYPTDIDALVFGLAMPQLDAPPDTDPHIERLRPRMTVIGSGG